MKKLRFVLIGAAAGILNGFFGAGGGLLVVPMLETAELEPQKAHATSLGIILPLSVISAVMYFMNGVPLNWGNLGISVLPGLLGAFLGSLILKRMKNHWLKRIFGLVMIVSAIRIFLG